jgi:cyclopropane fatty-acyl-phospholipid synthase-like methyltransferase
MINKPFSQACENNKAPILQIIRNVFLQPTTVWEIGSGTGQHACYFAEYLPHIIWQPTDKAENISGIEWWINDAKLANVSAPLVLDVTDERWPCSQIDALFTANTLHIMSWHDVQIFFERLVGYLSDNALMCIYGPFNYNGTFTSESNAKFDEWLKSRNKFSGIREFEAILTLAKNSRLELLNDFAMPANNRLLVFQRQK